MPVFTDTLKAIKYLQVNQHALRELAASRPNEVLTDPLDWLFLTQFIHDTELLDAKDERHANRIESVKSALNHLSSLTLREMAAALPKISKKRKVKTATPVFVDIAYGHGDDDTSSPGIVEPWWNNPNINKGNNQPK